MGGGHDDKKGAVDRRRRGVIRDASSRIETWGYEVITAQSGRIALDIVKGDKPDMVALDYIMPEWDGIATLRQIRKVDKKIPVIMLTVYQDDKSIDAAKS